MGATPEFTTGFLSGVPSITKLNHNTSWIKEGKEDVFCTSAACGETRSWLASSIPSSSTCTTSFPSWLSSLCIAGWRGQRMQQEPC